MKHKTESRDRLAEQRKKSGKITQTHIDFVSDHLKGRIGRRITVKGILLDLDLSHLLIFKYQAFIFREILSKNLNYKKAE